MNELTPIPQLKTEIQLGGKPMICRCSAPKQKPSDKRTLKLLGLSKDWEIMYRTHDEIVARYKPTGETLGFRY